MFIFIYDKNLVTIPKGKKANLKYNQKETYKEKNTSKKQSEH